jgi:opacity protein-like surface antigen
MRRFLLGAFLVVLAAGPAGFAAAASAKEEVTSSVVNANTVVWRITEPVITQAKKSYTKIKFEPGDTITLEAGGCDQTGGHGATWKRYVDPQGANADQLYHGLIEIPGVTEKFKASPTGPKGLVRMLDMGMKNLSTGQFRGRFVVGDLSKVAEKDRYLRLGFEDDGYSDNGYWGRDDGTGDQCKDLGTSYVAITIAHRVIHPLAGSEKAVGKEAEKGAGKAATPPGKSK